MVDVLSLDLVEKRCIADQLVLYVRYDKDSLISRELNDYTGPISKDWYGRKVPKHNVSSTNSEQCKLYVHSSLYIDARLLWKQTIGGNGS